jgi:hypothetical protein
MKPYLVGKCAMLAACAGVAASAQTPVGAEFQVNTYTTNSQGSVARPGLALDAAGNFVAVWDSETQDGSGAGIFAQRYDSSGAPRGGEFRVNTFTTHTQSDPVVASDASGNFVVAWASELQVNGLDVFAQRFAASGAPVGSEFRVNTYATNHQWQPTVASDAAGNFVIAWTSYEQDGSVTGVFAQRYDTAGVPRGSEFQVNTSTFSYQFHPSVASDAAGHVIVTWQGHGLGGDDVFAQRYDASGVRNGAEVLVNTATTGEQRRPVVSADSAGNFVIAWESAGLSAPSVYAQRFSASGTRRGPEFQVNANSATDHRPSVASDGLGNFVVVWESIDQIAAETNVLARFYDAAGAPRGAQFGVNSYTTENQGRPSVAMNEAGNIVVAWQSAFQDGDGLGIFGQRYGGLSPAELALDNAGNRVLEPGETVDVRPSWRNVSGVGHSFTGALSNITGPAGAAYIISDAAAIYGTVANGATAQCTDCYAVGVSDPTPRPAVHWDASAVETIAPDGQQHQWVLHVGSSFADVGTASPFYRFIETLLHHGVTGGCSGSSYCPAATTTRDQMAVFVLVAKERAGYLPPACTVPLFPDVPVSSPFCPWIEELARRGVVSGCGGGAYCPSNAVSREQMAVFVLRTLDPVLAPAACTAPVYADVPTGSPFCAWIEELTRRGVVSGCGGGNYCPGDGVTREQMGVFITATFGLRLYGP